MKKIPSFLLLSLISGAMTLGAYKLFFEPTPVIINDAAEKPSLVTTSYSAVPSDAGATDFTEAAEKTVHAVVHVKNLTISRAPSSLFDYYYGSGGTPRAQIGTGSGVIISPDGYIVTNNHVIANASELQVTLNNNRTYQAELIGTDPETDIALIKVNAEEDLPYLPFGDSNQIKLGEWVLAVGNPFNLTSTVTAGIISAKARDLDEQDQRFQSFIQTDAAVNPGNSGGALVNTRGELVGINTAITSQTGSYVGYSFAVPSNIARKVVDDLMEYGDVQVVNIGIRGSDLKNLGPNNREVIGTDETEGIYIAEIIEDSGAEKAGLKKGDIIKSIDGIKISKFADLTGYLRTKRPDDQVSVMILRDQESISIPVTLLKDARYRIDLLNITVRDLDNSDKRIFKQENGVKITDAGRYQELEGKLIIRINDTEIHNVEDVRKAEQSLDQYRTSSMVIMYENGEKERLIFRD